MQLKVQLSTKLLKVWAFVMAGLGVLLDIIDVVMFFAAPDAVVFKSVVNICSSCAKWIAFGVVELLAEMHVFTRRSFSS